MQVIERATMIRKRSTAAKQDLACTSAGTEPGPWDEPARRRPGTAPGCSSGPGIDQASYRLVIDAGHNEGTSLPEDAGYDEKCRDEKTQVRSIAEDVPQSRGCPALFHPGL